MKRFITAALVAAITMVAVLPYSVSFAGDAEKPIPTKGWTIIADEPEERELTPEDFFRLGEENYELGEYEAAKENLEAALDGLDDSGLRAKCFERLAFVYAAFGMNEEVHDAFAESLKLDSSLILDPDIVSPKVYEFYISARNEVVREGILVVNSDPPGAVAYLDGKPIGEAPVRLEHVTEGEYMLVVMKRGYETSSGPVVIKKDITLTVDEKLARARGALTIISNPPGVAVMLDGEPEGATPTLIENVSGGAHTLLLARPNFEEYSADITLEKGGEFTHNAVMQRRLLVVLVDTVEMDAARKLIEPGLSLIPGLVPAYTGMDELCAELESRGLSSGSVDFARACKRSLELGETAVISGIMENAKTELALVVSHSPGGAEDGSPTETLQLALYGAAGELADVFSRTDASRGGLSGCVDDFVKAWLNVTDADESTFGMVTIDRADGRVETLQILPGYPADKAGVTAGMYIKSVDGSPVSDNATLYRLTSNGAAHEFEFTGIKPSKVTIEPVCAYTEAPVDSGVYLYNLALADLSAYIDATLEEAEADPTKAEKIYADAVFGYAALNLGNVYRHFGRTSRAIESLALASLTSNSGVCQGTVLFRMGEAYEQKGLWPQAADAYRTAMLIYPEATMGDSGGPRIAPAATGRLKRLYRLGFLKERWWL